MTTELNLNAVDRLLLALVAPFRCLILFITATAFRKQNAEQS